MGLPAWLRGNTHVIGSETFSNFYNIVRVLVQSDFDTSWFHLQIYRRHKSKVLLTTFSKTTDLRTIMTTMTTHALITCLPDNLKWVTIMTTCRLTLSLTALLKRRKFPSPPRLLLRGRKPPCSRRPRKKNILRAFDSYLQRGKVPNKSECEKFMEQNPATAGGASWRQIKNCVYTKIQNKNDTKRKLLGALRKNLDDY